MIVAWTGHRPDLFNDAAVAQAAVDALARDLVEHQAVARFVVGGQRGVDTWAARAAIALGVPLTLILPLEAAEFARDWPADARKLLELTLTCASEIRIVGGERQRAFSERNRLLATEADLLVAVWTGLTGGGTAETIALACANGTPLREVLLMPAPRAGSAQGRGI
jgi:predicted Rossmann fold nucleotide-binding protein DprA/Smf involved in DNA uptake